MLVPIAMMNGERGGPIQHLAAAMAAIRLIAKNISLTCAIAITGL